MKKIVFALLLGLPFLALKAQNCIDAIIIEVTDNEKIYRDTIHCKILTEDPSHFVIDNGYAISSIAKPLVVETLKCYREMTAFEIYKYSGIDAVTFDDFNKRNSAGYHLRKAAFNAYIATGLALIGGTSLTIGLTVFSSQKNLKNGFIIGGAACTAASLFFIIRGWEQVYKAGKILDLKRNSALYVTPTQNGDLGLVLKF